MGQSVIDVQKMQKNRGCVRAREVTSMHDPAHLLLHCDAVIVALHDTLRWRDCPIFFKSESSSCDSLRQQKKALCKFCLHALIHVENALHHDDCAAQPRAHVPTAARFMHIYVGRQHVANQPSHRYRLVHHLACQASGI